MKEYLNELQGKLPSGDRLYSLLAACTIAAIIVAYGLIMALSLLPELRTWKDLSAQVAAADAALAEARDARATSPNTVQKRLAAAQATLAQAASIFLSEAQTADIPTRLYRYASASGVEIVSLQSQPAKGSAEDMYSVRTFDVQVAGPLSGLIACLSRIDEATLPGCIISGVNISAQNDGRHVLTMDIVTYTSPYASQVSPTPLADVPPATPVPTLAPTAALPPTTTPTPEPIVYTVRSGDTLFSIARRYGTSVEAIMAANGLADSMVRTGQQLTIPVD